MHGLCCAKFTNMPERPHRNRNGVTMTDKIHRLPHVIEWSGLSSSAIYEQIAEGTFPKPIRIGKRAVGWTESSLTAWLTSKQVDAV